MNNAPLLRLCAMVLVALATAAPVPAEQVPQEMQAQVPELWKFHQVIFQLWHHAWPEKDFARMRELLPEVRAHVRAVADAELPGILRDKVPKWEAGVEALKASLRDYEEAIASGDEQGMLDATEELHARFEQLVRIVRPATKQIDAYHVELYKIYHYHLPGKDLEALRETSALMARRCDELEAADLPRRLAGRAEELKERFAELCRRTDALAEAARKAKKWRPRLERKIESVHDQYLAVEHALE